MYFTHQLTSVFRAITILLLFCFFVISCFHLETLCLFLSLVLFWSHSSSSLFFLLKQNVFRHSCSVHQMFLSVGFATGNLQHVTLVCYGLHVAGTFTCYSNRSLSLCFQSMKRMKDDPFFKKEKNISCRNILIRKNKQIAHVSIDAITGCVQWYAGILHSRES